jgi:hypothetical protein
MCKIFCILFALVITLPVLAQDTTLRKNDIRHHYKTYSTRSNDGITYHKQSDFGIKLTSDGYGAFFEMGRIKSPKKTLLFQLEITEKKSAKEDKVTNPGADGSPFIYGKENFFYPIKLGVQEQILLAEKASKNGVNISTNFGGGLIIGLVRPYEMQVITDSIGDTKFVTYNSPDSNLFLTPGSPPLIDLSNGAVTAAMPGFISGPDFTQGWNALSVIPGLYAKGALRCDYGSSNELVTAIEIGLTAEYYTKKVPLVVYVPDKQFFLSTYITIIFGKRK